MKKIIVLVTAVFFSLGLGLGFAQEAKDMPWEQEQKPLLKSRNSKSDSGKTKKATAKKAKKKKVKKSEN